MISIILFIPFQKTKIYQNLLITVQKGKRKDSFLLYVLFAACNSLNLTYNNFPLEVNFIL